MRDIGIHGVVSASQRLRERLSATSGIHHLLSSHENSSVLHNTSRAARNFSRTPPIRTATSAAALAVVEGSSRVFTSRAWCNKATESVVKIQAAFKRWRTRKRYVETYAAVLSIQRWYRARRARKVYLLYRSRVTAVQAHARGFLVRRMVEDWNSSAFLIQKHWRLHKRSRESAATRIQAHFRRFLLRRHLSRSATGIHAAFRGWRDRRRYAVVYAGVVTVQRWFRARKLRKEFVVKRWSSTVIQAHARGFLVRRIVREWNSATSLIQQRWRLYQRFQAAHRQAKQFLEARQSIQAAFRGWRTRRSYVKIRSAVLCIQRWYRARKQFKLESGSSTVIQAHARGFVARAMVKRWNLAASSIQQRWRLHQGTRDAAAEFRTMRRDAMKIQAAFRGWRARKSYVVMHSAVLRLQKWYRASKLDRVQRQSTTVIQAHARGFLARRMVRLWNLAATRIQACFRRVMVRRQFLTARRNAIRIQAALRSRLVQKKMMSERKLATYIQAHVRRFLVAKRLERWNYAARLIQRTWKEQLACRVKRSWMSATSIQAHARGFLVRQKLRRYLSAACVIQRHWKEHSQPKEIQQSEAFLLSPTEDWNDVEVEHLDECLDTYLGVLAARRTFGLELPRLDLHISPSYNKDDFSGYKDSLKENELQQVARVFLLRHHIAVEQQRAQHAPPFPPAQPDKANTANHNVNSSDTILQQQKLSGEPTTRERQTGDVILDVHNLLEELHKKSSASPSSVVYMRNDSLVSLEERTGLIQQETSLRRHQPELLSLNVLLMVFFAVIVYTRSVCRGVILWATNQSATRK